MKIDMDTTEFHEGEWAEAEFSAEELAHARYLLRRLRYLSQQLRERHAAAPNASGGAVFAEKEVASLEWGLGPEGNNDHAPTGRP